MVSWKPNAAFYLLPSRAWELMVGGLLAVGVFPQPHRLRTPFSIVGLIFIAVPMLTYSEAVPFPGFAAVPPVVGTALVIWAGRDALAGRWLSFGPLVAVGQASYSIYLWHLPLLDFGGYLVAGRLSTSAALFLCAVSVALGFASLYFIERPFRAKGEHRNRKALVAALGMVSIGAASLSIIALQGIPSRLNSEAAKIAAVADDENRHRSDCMTLGAHIVPPAKACRIGANVEPATLLWGDSHAMVTATAMEVTAKREDQSFLFAADADCPIALGLQIASDDYAYCERYNREMLQLALSSQKLRTIVLSSRWTKWNMGEPANPADFPFRPPLLRYRNREARSVSENKLLWEESFTALVDRLVRAGKRVVIVGPVPEPPFNVPHRLFVQRFGIAEPVTALSREQSYTSRHRSVLAFFGALRGRQGLSFVWPVDVLCRADKCPIVDGNGPLFFDHNHLSIEGSLKIAPLFVGVFDGRASHDSTVH
jgi:hypothetical protein